MTKNAKTWSLRWLDDHYLYDHAPLNPLAPDHPEMVRRCITADTHGIVYDAVVFGIPIPQDKLDQRNKDRNEQLKIYRQLRAAGVEAKMPSPPKSMEAQRITLTGDYGTNSLTLFFSSFCTILTISFKELSRKASNYPNSLNLFESQGIPGLWDYLYTHHSNSHLHHAAADSRRKVQEAVTAMFRVMDRERDSMEDWDA